MEPESSLPRLQVPATCTYPEPNRSSLCPPPPSCYLKIYLNIYIYIYIYIYIHIQAPYIPSNESQVPFSLLRSYQRINPGPRQKYLFGNKAIFYGDELLAPRPNPKMDHPLSDVRDCLLNIFAAIVHIGGRSSIRNLRTRSPW